MSKTISQRVKEMRTRTPFEKTVKEALMEALDIDSSSEVELKMPVDKNNKPVLEAFAKAKDIEVPDPQHKEDYVKAVEDYLEDA